MFKRSLFSIISLLLISFTPLFADQGGTSGTAYMWTNTDAPAPQTNFEWTEIGGNTPVISGPWTDPGSVSNVALPFDFDYFGSTKTQFWVSTHGWLSFSDPSGDAFEQHFSMPTGANPAPTEFIAPYWSSSLQSSAAGGIYTETVGTAPFRRTIVQWEIYLDPGGDEIIFQAILYETTNVIKFQYKSVDPTFITSGSATIGIQENSASAEEFYSGGVSVPISSDFALLWHSETVTSADAAISPTSVNVNSLDSYTYTINNIVPASTDFLGKLDQATIAIPTGFTSTTVTSVSINGGTAFIQNSATKPTQRGFATWEISGSNLIVRTADFEVINSMIVNFVQQSPATATDYDFSSSVDAVLDNSGSFSATDQGWTVTVNAASPEVDYYTITADAGTSMNAGGSLNFTVNAFDENDNAVSDPHDVAFSVNGSNSVVFSTNDTLTISGTTLGFSVSDTVKGNFTIKAQKVGDASVSGSSELVTVNPAAAASFDILSSQSDIKAGTDRLLQVAVNDQYDNRLNAGTTVNFAVNSGSGSLSASSDDTDANGIAEVTFTASTEVTATSGVNDVIDITSTGATPAQMSMVVIADNVSYYSFSPSTNQSFTAGSPTGVSYTITARDQYDNATTSSDINISSQGTATPTFSPLNPVSFTGSTASVTVTGTQAGAFTVNATKANSTNITGTSGLVTINPDVSSPAITKLTSEADIKAGTERLIQVALEDQYGNRLGAGTTVNFAVGSGSGSLSASSDDTDANGIAQVTFTASTEVTATSGVNDVIDITSTGATPAQMSMVVIADNVSYYSFSPSTNQSFTAGSPTGVSYTITARDQYDNATTSSDINISSQGTATPTFSPLNPVSFTGSTASVTVTGTQAGAFTVNATKANSTNITGTSGLVTINPDVSSPAITKLTSEADIKAGTERLIQVALEDQYGNRLGAGTTVNFAIGSGSGSLSASSDDTDANGIAQVTFTASTEVTATSGVNDVIDITSTGATPAQMNMVVIADNVSYYSFSPSTNQSFTAGSGNVAFTVTARDQYDNAVVNNDNIVFTAQGSPTASFSPSSTVSFGNSSTANVTVSDNTAGVFTVKGVKQSATNISGVSGEITVNTGAITTLNILSSQSNIKAGAERLLQVALEDAFGNRAAAGESVTFTVTSGGGTFVDGTGLATVTTNAFGIADTVFIADTTAGGSDVIQVSYNALNENITLPVIGNNISYYSFSPSTNQSFTAGSGNVAFTVTARDQYDNAVVNNDNIVFTAQGSATASFTPSSTVSFGNSSTANVTVSDNTAGLFTVKGVKQSATNISGVSGEITVNAGAASQFAILSSSADIVAGTSRVLRVQLQDAFNNALGSGIDVIFTRSSGTGLFSNDLANITVVTDADGIAEATYNASAGSGGTDVIDITSAPATPGQISLDVVAGALARLKIQKTAVANGFELADTTLTADGGFTVYAAGYDAAGNFIGLQNASWTGFGVVSGNLTPGVPSNNAAFDAVAAGSGSIRATVGSITDNTGGITVSPGATASLVIMDAPNNEGSAVNTDSKQVGETLNLFANGFDSDGNFSGNVVSNWSAVPASYNTDLNNGNRTNLSNITFLPTQAGTATITAALATNGTINDGTGNITVTNGSLARLVIQTNANDGGPELDDDTIQTNETITAYAAGYDIYDNFLGLQNATWTGSGIIQAANLSPANPTNTITFTPSVIGTGKITAVAGGFNDNSGLITVNAGPATQLNAIGATTLSGAAGSTLSDSLVVQLLDAKNNPVSGEIISWSTTSTADGGLVSPGGTPAGITNSQGISRAKWKLRNSSSAGTDNATAAYNALTVDYTANLSASDADQLVKVSTDQSGTVGQAVGEFRVRVLDPGGTPVQGVPISFSVTLTPSQADGYSLSTVNVLTNASGEAATVLTLGDKAGTYTVAAYNAGLTPSQVTFSATASASSADSLVLVSGNNQSGTVGTALSSVIAVRAVDQFGNAVSGVTVGWSSPDGGSVSGSAVTGANGIDDVTWTLGNVSGSQTLNASISGIFTLPINATANPGTAVNIVAVSGNNSTTVAGSTQKLEARLTDQFGNNVPGSSVTFSPVNSMSALNSQSDANGLVSAVYRTPSNNNSSVATITSASAGSVDFTVYGIRYVENSLLPKSINIDSTESFTVDVLNPGPGTVTLNTAESQFKILHDGTTDSTSLDSPSSLPNGTTTLQFSPVQILGDYPSGNYTGEITLVGSGAYSSMNGTLNTNVGELAISPLNIESVSIPLPEDTVVARGGNLTINMLVSNNSANLLVNLNPVLTFSSGSYSVTADAGNPTQLLAGEQRTFVFDVNVDQGNPAGFVTVDGNMDAEYSGGGVIKDFGADQTAQFRVVESATLAWESYTPLTVSEGQVVTFTANVTNNGGYDIILNKTNTSLTFGGNVFQLATTQSLEAGQITVLTFTRVAPISLTAASSPYAGTLVINGTEVGNAYSNTLTTTAEGLPALIVQTASNLIFDSVTLSTDSVSQGQTGETLTFQVTNNGQASLQIASADDITLFVDGADIVTTSYQNVLVSPSFPVTIPGSGSQTFIYTINTGSSVPAGADEFSVQVDYTDQNSNSSLAATSITNPSWLVLTGSALSISNLVAVNAQVTKGQTGLPVSFSVQNTGQSTVSVTSADLEFVRNNNNVVAAITSFPFQLEGGASQLVEFTVDIDANAATGIDQIRGVATGTNILSGEAVSITSAYLDSWNVVEAPTISVVSVNAARDTVSTGQQNISVVVSIQNTSASQLQLEQVTLSMSRGTYNGLDTVLAVPVLINPGATTDVDVLVDISAVSASGVSTIAAAASGTVNGTPVSDNTAQTTDSWLVQKAVNTSITGFTPSIVSTGQSFNYAVTVRNTGEAALIIDKNSTIFYPVSSIADSVKLTAGSPGRIEGNQSAQLTFNSKSFITPLTAQLMQLRLVGTDNGVIYSSTISSPNNFTVQSQAVMNIISTSTVADSVTHGQIVPVTVLIENSGQATLVVDNLDLNGVNLTDLTPALPSQISGGAQQPYVANYTVPGPVTGDINLNAAGIGRDINSNTSANDASTTTQDSWFAATPPNVNVTTLVSTETTVTQGQSGIPVDVTVTNSGGTPVLVTSMSILPSRGIYSRTWENPVFNFKLHSGQSVTRRVFLTVSASSATGADTLLARVNFTNNYTSATSQITGTDSHIWQIIGSTSSAVNIVSVSTDPTLVSRGQGPIPVTVLVENGSQSSATINTVSLLFDDGTANSSYTFGAVSPALPFDISAGASRAFIVPVSVDAGASTGQDVISASVNVTTLSGTEDKTNSNATDSWQVQLRPSLVVDSVTVSPAIVSTGQTGLRASVYLRNEANINRAVAQIDDVDLQFSGGGFTNIVRSSIPTLPLTLPQGTSSRIDFTFSSGTSDGTFTLDANVDAIDINDDFLLTVNGAAQTDQITVQDAAQLQITDFWVDPDVVSTQQSGNIYIEVSNQGQASLEIRSKTLTNNQGANLQSVFQGPQTPFTITGGSNDTLVYSFIAPENQTGTITLNASVQGIDLNSGLTTQDTDNNGASFVVQEAASIELVSVSPLTISSLNDPVQFEVTVRNTGEASITLNNQTSLEFGTVESILLDSGSPTVLAGNSETTLIFTETTITTTPNRVYPLELRLRGTTNQAVYSNNIDAGTVAYGIEGITISSIIPGVSSALQGTQNITVSMNVSSGIPGFLPIHAPGTFLFFEQNGATANVDNLQRIDTVTIVGGAPEELQFTFDLPSDLSTQPLTIFGQLSIDGGNTVVRSDTIGVNGVSGTINVLSQAQLDYVASSIIPASVVTGQRVAFQLGFQNTGTASINLDPATSYIEFEGVPGTPRRFLTNNFTVSGGGTTNYITFSEFEIPSNISSTEISFVLNGVMLNNQSVEETGNISNAFQILPGADLRFSNIAISPEPVYKGQKNINVNYTIENTGGSDATVTGINQIFRISTTDVSSSWLRTSTNEFPKTVSAGSDTTFQFVYTIAQDAATGTVTPDPVVNYRDVRVPGTAMTSNTIIANDQVSVIEPAAVRIDSLYISSGVPNKPFVNQGQNFSLGVRVTNNGQVNVTQGTIVLNYGTTTLTRPIGSLGAGASVVRTFSNLSLTNTRLFTASLENVQDVDANQVATEQPLDNSENIIVQVPRSLAVGNVRITAPQSSIDNRTVAQDQEFTIAADIVQSGQSAYGTNGRISLILPGNYSLIGGETVQKTFSNENLSVSWKLKADNATNNFDRFIATISTLPNDLNTGTAVDTNNAYAPFLVKSEPIGSLNISSVTKQNTPNTVSTEQQFTMQAQITRGTTIENTTASISLPSGFALAPGEQLTKSFSSSTTLTWNVVAPAAVSQSQVTFSVNATGQDRNSGETINKIAASGNIQVVKRATLSLKSEISQPDGAQDLVVSTSQNFILRTTILNSGQANFDTSGVLQLRASGGITFEENGAAVLNIAKFSTTPINKTVVIPANNGSGYVEAVILTAPKDQYSNDPATIKADSTRYTLQIQKRADLVLTVDKAGIDQEGILQRATNQDFYISAIVRNRGVAGVDTSGGRHIATLDTNGTGLTILDGDSTRMFTIGDTVRWYVLSSSVERITEAVPVRIYVASQQQPLDENEEVSAFRSSAVSSDTLNIKFNNIEDINLSAEFEAIPQEGDTLVVSINQDKIQVNATIGFDDQLTGVRTAELVLPTGYSSVGNNLIFTRDSLSQNSNTRKWLIKAPSDASEMVDTLKIRVFGFSADGLLKKSDSTYLYIKTIPKARLALSLSIDQPIGASDDTVSVGQQFRLRGIITNRVSGSEVDPESIGEVTLNIDNSIFEIISNNGTPAGTVQSFTVGTPFYWWLEANASTGQNNVSPLAAFLDYKKSQIGASNSTVKKTRPAEAQSLDPKKRAYEALTQAVKDFSEINASKPLTVQITRRPLDNVLKSEVDVENASESVNVVVEPEAKITMLGSPKILNNNGSEISSVSTGQVFAYQVSADTISKNLAFPQAVFILPGDLTESGIEQTVVLPIDTSTKTVSLNINVPQVYTGTSQLELAAYLIGIDENQADTLIIKSSEKSTVLNIEERPDIVLKSAILSPQSAIQSGVLSFGQEIVVKVWADYTDTQSSPSVGWAEITGEGVISLNQALINSSNFILPDGQTLSKTFTALGEQNALTWRIKAPGSARTANAIFSITTRPVDENSGLAVASSDPAESYGLTVRQKEIVIIPRADLVTSNSFRQNQNNLRLLAFDISNKGQVDKLKGTSLVVKFLSGEGVSDNPLDASALSEMFSSLKVVKEDYIKPESGDNLGKTTSTLDAIELSNISIEASSPNPIKLHFNIADTLIIDPDTLVTMFVLADFKQNAKIRSFRTKLDSITLFDVDESIPLKLVTSNGEDFLASTGATSGNQNILSEDEAENFFIYPNPFGRGASADLRLGRFNFSIDSETGVSNVKLSIYTLLGELVISKTRDNLSPGTYDNEFSWDGRNGNGKQVLNGAYIAVLEVKPVDGGSVKRYIIKIAYIK